MSYLFLAGLALAAPSDCPHHHRGDLVVAQPSDIPSCLETVDGDLVVGTSAAVLRFPQLTDVTGKLDLTLSRKGRAVFPRLERVHGRFEAKLRGTRALELPRLAWVGAALGVDADPLLGASGLERVRRLEGGLWLFGGGELGELLPGLEVIHGTVLLQPSAPMRHLLPGLTRVGGHVVSSNGAHLTLTGLGALESVGGGLYLFGGRDLALPALKRVGGALAIRDSRLTALSQLGSEGTQVGALLLRDNPKLAKWPSHLDVPKSRIQVRGSPELHTP